MITIAQFFPHKILYLTPHGVVVDVILNVPKMSNLIILAVVSPTWSSSSRQEDLMNNSNDNQVLFRWLLLQLIGRLLDNFKNRRRGRVG